ncbi:MAG: hypothetical protein HOW73_45500 [Polyangiaceae bacterium]|nr:hypothetical protein [Polyangiaceae bacterium]
MTMVDKDPAGLLERMPELQAIAAEDVSVRRAIERGAPHDVYRRLWWLRLLGRMRHHREPLDLLIARRRLFLTPIRSAPVMATLNGVGTRVYGESERDYDGTYLTSLFVTVLFVPVFPLSTYLVADGHGQGSGRSWRFIGKVPFGGALYLWQRALALLAVGGIVASAMSAFYASRHNEVQVLNGLPVAVTVSIEGAKSVEVLPFGRTMVDVPTGVHAVDVRSGDRLVESGSIDVHAGVDVLAYNVLGISALYAEEVVYTAAATSSNGAEPVVHCDQRVVEIDDVDYAFTSPPEQLKSDKRGGAIRKRHVDVASGGALACVYYLLDTGRTDRAVALMTQADEASGFDPSLHPGAMQLEQQYGDREKALLLAEQGRSAHQGSLDHHRIYQDMMLGFGRRDELIADYTARRDSAPDSADAAYLLARVQPLRPGLAPYAELVKRFPKHGYLLRAHVHDRFIAADFQAAIQASQELRSVDAKLHAEAFGLVIEAMVALGQVEEALQQIENMFATAEASDKEFLATLYALSAQRASSDHDRDLLFSKLEKPETPRQIARRLAARVNARLDISPSELTAAGTESSKTALDLLRALEKDPAASLANVVTAPDGVIGAIPPQSWALAYCEAVRSNPDGEAARRLARGANEAAHALAEYLESGDDAALIELEPSMRAAAHFVRSRNTALPDLVRAELRARATEEDILKTVITAAIQNWPTP